MSHASDLQPVPAFRQIGHWKREILMRLLFYFAGVSSYYMLGRFDNYVLNLAVFSLCFGLPEAALARSPVLTFLCPGGIGLIVLLGFQLYVRHVLHSGAETVWLILAVFSFQGVVAGIGTRTLAGTLGGLLAGQAGGWLCGILIEWTRPLDGPVGGVLSAGLVWLSSALPIGVGVWLGFRLSKLSDQVASH